MRAKEAKPASFVMIEPYMYHITRHHIHNAKYLDRNQLYWATTIKTFAVSLVGVFVPAYLYKLGYSIRTILLYFLIREIVELVMVLPTTASMKYFGVKQTFTLGSFVTLGNLYLLYVLPSHSSVFVWAAIIEGLAISLFFLPYHYLFSAAVTKKAGGMQLGWMDIWLSIVTALGPLLGGLIATASNLQTALLLALVLVVIAILPLIKRGDKQRLSHASFTAPFALLFTHDSVSNMGFGVTEMVATIIWPLFIFLIVGSYATVGIIISLSLLLIVFMDALAGRWTDKGKYRQLLTIGSWSSSVVHLIRIAAITVPGATAINLASDATHTLFRVPWTTAFYRHASEAERATYIAAMELAVCVGRLALWIVLWVFAASLTSHNLWWLAFVLGAAGSLLVPLIARRPNYPV